LFVPKSQRERATAISHNGTTCLPAAPGARLYDELHTLKQVAELAELWRQRGDALLPIAEEQGPLEEDVVVEGEEDQTGATVPFVLNQMATSGRIPHFDGRYITFSERLSGADDCMSLHRTVYGYSKMSRSSQRRLQRISFRAYYHSLVSEVSEDFTPVMSGIGGKWGHLWIYDPADAERFVSLMD
jgi:hypothetical protein